MADPASALRTDQDWATWLRETALGTGPDQAGAAARSVNSALPGLWDSLGWLARRYGVAVDRLATTKADSQTDWASRRIAVSAETGSGVSDHLLLHELAHVLLHDRGVLSLGADTSACRGLPKVEADSVACVVATWLGLDTSGYTWPYTASWAGSDPRAQPERAVLAATTRITNAAGIIISHLEVALFGRQPRWVLALPTQVPGPQPERLTQDPHRRPLELSRGNDDPLRAEILSVLQAAEQFYLGNLDRSWVGPYLSGRGFDKDIVQRWRIGFAPGGWTALTDHLRDLGHRDELIQSSGLARVSSRGTLIDHFRNRVMLPSRDGSGVIVGFIGRAHPKARSDVPKYLNSPETAVYSKGEVLFGLGESRRQLVAGAMPVIVEGPFDAIAVSVADPGAYAGLAPCGTALTTLQVTALAQVVDLADAVVLVALDGDRAGRDAALRSHRMLNAAASRPAVAKLPAGQDPADILQAEGPAALRSTLERFEPLAQLVIDAHLDSWEPKLRDAEGRLAALRSVAVVIAGTLPESTAESIRAVTGGRPIQTLDERMRPLVNSELAQIASLLPISPISQIARAADRLNLEYSDVLAAVANVRMPLSPSSLANADFPEIRRGQAVQSERAPPSRRTPRAVSSRGRRSGR